MKIATSARRDIDHQTMKTELVSWSGVFVILVLPLQALLVRIMEMSFALVALRATVTPPFVTPAIMDFTSIQLIMFVRPTSVLAQMVSPKQEFPAHNTIQNFAALAQRVMSSVSVVPSVPNVMSVITETLTTIVSSTSVSVLTVRSVLILVSTITLYSAVLVIPVTSKRQLVKLARISTTKMEMMSVYKTSVDVITGLQLTIQFVSSTTNSSALNHVTKVTKVRIAKNSSSARTTDATQQEQKGALSTIFYHSVLPDTNVSVTLASWTFSVTQ